MFYVTTFHIFASKLLKVSKVSLASMRIILLSPSCVFFLVIFLVCHSYCWCFCIYLSVNHFLFEVLKSTWIFLVIISLGFLPPVWCCAYGGALNWLPLFQVTYERVKFVLLLLHENLFFGRTASKSEAKL